MLGLAGPANELGTLDLIERQRRHCPVDAGLNESLERAREINLPVVTMPQWYDVDDEYTLRLLQAELAGQPVTGFAMMALVGFTTVKTVYYPNGLIMGQVLRKN